MCVSESAVSIGLDEDDDKGGDGERKVDQKRGTGKYGGSNQGGKKKVSERPKVGMPFVLMAKISSMLYTVRSRGAGNCTKKLKITLEKDLTELGCEEICEKAPRQK